MSFREKSTWVTFVLLLATFGIYFGNAFLLLHGANHSDGHSDGHSTPSLFKLFFQLVFWFIVIEIVIHIVLAMRSPKDANDPMDEREKLIELKSIRPSYYVLLVGAFLVIGTMHLGATSFHMAHSVLFVIWIAELVRYGMRLYCFRRGA